MAILFKYGNQHSYSMADQGPFKTLIKAIKARDLNIYINKNYPGHLDIIPNFHDYPHRTSAMFLAFLTEPATRKDSTGA